MNKWRVLLAFLPALMALDVAAETKIGVVSFREVIAKSPQRDAIGEKLKKEFNDRADALKKLNADMQAQDEKLKRDGATMSAQQVTDAKRNLEKMYADFQLKKKAFDEDVQRREGEESAALEKRVMQAVNAIAAKEGYQLILAREAAPFFQPTMDITPQVLAAISNPAPAGK